jgi:hypothetical protein
VGAAERAREYSTYMPARMDGSSRREEENGLGSGASASGGVGSIWAPGGGEFGLGGWYSGRGEAI